MVGEARHEDLRHLPEGRVELKRASEPLADPLEETEPVGLALRVPPPGLGDQQHDAVDLAGGGPQRHREFPHEQKAAVAPVAGERVFPRASGKHLPGDLLHPAGLAVGQQAEAAERLAEERCGREVKAEHPGNVFVREHYVAGAVRNHDADLGLAQH